MKAVESFLKITHCATCGRPFEEGDIVVSFKGKSEGYCLGCEGESLIMAVSGGYDKEYREYLYHENVAYPVVNEKFFSELDNGIYEIMLCTSKRRTSFVYCGYMGDEENAGGFAASALRKNFVLEKDNSFVCLYFPAGLNMSKTDFLSAQENFGKLMDCLNKWTGYPTRFLFDEKSRIVGFFCGSVGTGVSAVAQGYYKDTLEVKSMWELKQDLGLEEVVSITLNTLTPRKMLEYCEGRIYGQGNQLKKAVYLVYRYLQSVASGKSFRAENWILTSPSGTGKTEFYRAIRALFKKYEIAIPVVQIDLSQITETGYRGANVDTIPERIAKENPDAKGYGICFLDEADKKFIHSYDHLGVDTNAAVQSNLLTLLEGTQLKAGEGYKSVDFDSSKTMFVFLGSFQHLRDDKQEKNLAKGRIGFGDDHAGKSEDAIASDAMYDNLTIDDMISCGMQEEIAGRITYVVNFHKLSEEDMRTLIRRKVDEISREIGVEIVITDDAVEDFLSISFGNMGVRAPMNQIKELVQEEIAIVFFENGFDERKQRIVIDSVDRAHVEDVSGRENGGFEVER